MLRPVFAIAALMALSACMSPGDDLATGLADTRVTFPSPDPEGGPLVFEFYADGTGLLALDEDPARGQTPLMWRIDGDQLCLSGERPEDCATVVLRGTRITLQDGNRDPMPGFVEPL
ncbi:MAG: hypothetical protein AAGL89_10040 [Pseudomonadota bacterium]